MNEICVHRQLGIARLREHNSSLQFQLGERMRIGSQLCSQSVSRFLQNAESSQPFDESLIRRARDLDCIKSCLSPLGYSLDVLYPAYDRLTFSNYYKMICVFAALPNPPWLFERNGLPLSLRRTSTSLFCLQTSKR